MSSIKLAPNASGTGEFTIAAPNSNTNRTLSLPDSSGTLLSTATAGVPVNGPAFSAYQSSAQTLSANTWTKVQLQTEEFDTASCFDNATNYRFTPNVAGYYQLTCNAFSTTANMVAVAVYKNGTGFKFGPQVGASNMIGMQMTALVYLNGSTDYVEFYLYLATSTALSATQSQIYFQGALVRSAT